MPQEIKNLETEEKEDGRMHETLFKKDERKEHKSNIEKVIRDITLKIGKINKISERKWS